MTTMHREWGYLLADEPLPHDADRGNVYRFHEASADLWAQHGVAVTSAHAHAWPGYRPSLWWQYSAPEVRARLDGTGSPLWESLRAYEPAYDFGLPRYWLTRRTVDIYRTHLDIELDGEPVDPSNPPTFESEAAFLRRHGLLLPGELARIPEDQFAPEPLPAKFWTDAR